MAKLTGISGFPEWLPEQKLLEDQIIEKIKTVYVNHGFVPLETPAVELLETLASKGVVDKELYLLKRAKAESDEEATLGLHFDLTVPLARYVAQHMNDLVFPFKRYQLQKVWRGERPQKGRFREFYQFDIDIIARDDLPVSCDAEVLSVIDKALQAIELPPYTISINNRKLLIGFFSSLDLTPQQSKEAMVAIDKIGKIGVEGVLKDLQSSGIQSENAKKIVALGQVRGLADSAKELLDKIGVDNKLFLEGIEETLTFINLLPDETRSRVYLDLSLARGLDYYTGVIYETVLRDYPGFGSVASGGRYSDLAGQFINKNLPGVGVSIGLSRLMELILSEKLLPLPSKSTASVLVAVYEEAQRSDCIKIADQIRSCGIAAEVYYKSPKLGKQIEYADKKGIPYVVFLDPESGKIQAKSILSKEQVEVESIEAWCKATIQ